jgi:hypothetical protein
MKKNRFDILYELASGMYFALLLAVSGGIFYARHYGLLTNSLSELGGLAIVLIVGAGIWFEAWLKWKRNKTNRLAQEAKADEQWKASCAELSALEREAGILDKVNDARLGPLLPYGWDSDAPSGSDQAREETKIYWREQEEYARWNIRRLYFAVPDLDLRKRLIEKKREITSNHREVSRHMVLEQRVKVGQAEGRGLFWWAWAAVGVAVAVEFGWRLFQEPGAIAGLGIAYFYGQFLKENALERRLAAVTEAKRLLQDAEEGYADILNREPFFTREEARSGEPGDAAKAA